MFHGYAPFSPVVEYRSVRFGISYYTIWDIVLYDLGYRTIRFGISYYTIWDIVLYDSVNRCPVWPKPGWWGEARPLATCNPPLTLPSAMQMDVCGGNKCHTCRWEGALAVMWPAVVFNHLIHSEMRLFCETFSMLQHRFFSALGVTLWHLYL